MPASSLPLGVPATCGAERITLTMSISQAPLGPAPAAVATNMAPTGAAVSSARRLFLADHECLAAVVAVVANVAARAAPARRAAGQRIEACATAVLQGC